MVDENFAWRLTQELVKIDSSDPGAYEGEIEHVIKRLIEQQLRSLIVLRSMPCRLQSSKYSPGAATLLSPCRV